MDGDPSEVRDRPVPAIRLHEWEERVRHCSGYRRHGPSAQWPVRRICLVSSDSDFTRLASRLREQGADVYGFGEQKTPESFRQACRRFIYTENLLPEAGVVTPEEGLRSKALHPPSAAIPILNKAIAQMETEDGWVGLGPVGQRLATIASDFDPRTYGFRKLSDLVRKTAAFDIEQPEGRAIRIRAKLTTPFKVHSKSTTGAATKRQHSA